MDDAPSAPGIYAWYARMQTGSEDWKIRTQDGRDVSTDAFADLLRQYASYHQPRPIPLRGEASYGGRWAGSLALEQPLDFISEMRSNGEDLPDEASDLYDTISSESGRKILATMLDQAIPVFSSPMYIGVAKDLNDRLLRHRTDFDKGVQWLSKNPGEAESLATRAKNFGLRAAAKGLAMEQLEVWVIETSPSGMGDVDAVQLRSIAHTTEWLLHKIFAPVLGKR
ncbi:hypothetical protein IEU95_09965 [Hoyosella rhizosphaerae]|uniref:hypothetical protein n=1 Tax=Hoyosella rhizosphaerae TaxID=1755582 RepID=UPI00166D97E3|nr:hypothetical protein [Hoyosella rhizosphaerae]MBN4927159.1 hypothetical protein [Hoyosella rhizosphaerae]